MHIIFNTTRDTHTHKCIWYKSCTWKMIPKEQLFVHGFDQTKLSLRRLQYELNFKMLAVCFCFFSTNFILLIFDSNICSISSTKYSWFCLLNMKHWEKFELGFSHSTPFSNMTNMLFLKILLSLNIEHLRTFYPFLR